MDTFYVKFYVKDWYLYDSADNRVVLRGINLPLLDNWDWLLSGSGVMRSGLVVEHAQDRISECWS
jgi:hypothetical protein